MKNIFKLMGVALLACTMIMVSCKKDDDNSSQASDGGYVLTINGNNPSWGFVEALAGEGIWRFQAAKSYDAEEEELSFPYFVTYLYQGELEDGTQVMAPGDFFQNAQYGTDFYFEEMLANEYGQTMSDYSLWDIPEYNFGSFDATAHTLICDYTYDFVNYEEFMEALTDAIMEDEVNWEDLTTDEQRAYYAAASEESTHKMVRFACNNYAFTPVSAQ